MQDRIANPESSSDNKKRESYVADVAASVAVGIRQSTARNGVRQIADFVNGMMFAGLLVQKNGAGVSERFADVFDAEMPKFLMMIEAGEYSQERAEMRMHEIGAVEQTPSEMLITVGMSAEGVVRQIGADYGLSASEQLRVVVFSIVLAVVASVGFAGVPNAMEEIRRSVKDKVAVWEELVPTDSDMFGDENTGPGED